jgi:hypothetical protein
VISKVLLPQSNIVAAFVRNNSSIFSDVPVGLSTYSSHNVTIFTTSTIVVVAIVVVAVVVFMLLLLLLLLLL